MTPNQLTSAWQAAGEKSDKDSRLGQFDPRRRTALERLADRYRRFYTIALIMIPTSFMIFSNSHLLPELRNRVLIGVVFSIYFLTSFLMDRYLYHGVREIDCYSMTVNEVASRALKLRRFHLRCMAILLPVALAMVGLALYMFSFDFYFILGVGAGAFVGGLIGFFQYKEFMKEYRTLIDE